MKKIGFLLLVLLFFLVVAISLITDVKIVKKVKTYSISLMDGERLIGTAVMYENEPYNLGVFNKEGHDFLGWFDDPFEGMQYASANGSSDGKVWADGYPSALYGRWSKKTYKLKLLLNGGENRFNATDIYEIEYLGDVPNSFPVPYKAGYLFNGWFTDSMGMVADSEGRTLSSMKLDLSVFRPQKDGTIRLTASYTRKIITYHFISEGVEIYSKSYYPNDIVKNYPRPTKDNCCFSGWFFDSSCKDEVSFPYDVDGEGEESVFFYAGFKEGTVDSLVFKSIAESNDTEYEVSYSGNGTEIVVPDSYYGKKITRIGRFSSKTVTSILLPESVKVFEAGAFMDCISLKEIRIPNSIQSIPNSTFKNCSSLEKIEIPASTTTIGESAFEGCIKLKSITIPKNVSKIGSLAFRNTPSLESIDVENGNLKFVSKDGILYSKTSGSRLELMKYPAAKTEKEFKADTSVSRILQYAFEGAGVSSFDVGSVTRIDDYAFFGCTRLLKIVVNGESSRTWGNGAFENCTNLKALIINGKSVPTIQSNTFSNVASSFAIFVLSNAKRSFEKSEGWSHLASRIRTLGDIFGDYAVEESSSGIVITQYFGNEDDVSIPRILNAKRIVGIGENAFSGSMVESVEIPEYVTEIGSGAFKDCSNLKSVVINSDSPPVLNQNAFSKVSKDFGIYVKGNSSVVQKYKNTKGWKEFASRIWSYSK